MFGAEILPKSERNGPKNVEFFVKTEGIRTDTMARILEREITLFHPYSRNKSD